MCRTQQGKQRGFILALALLMMLFVGLVVITGTERTGTETRVATSNQHRASLESALYSGLNKIKQVSRKNVLPDKEQKIVYDNISKLLEDDFLGVAQEFQPQSGNVQAIYWKLDDLDYFDESKIKVDLIAWQGEELNPILFVNGRATISIKKVEDAGEDEETGPPGAELTRKLAEALGDYAGKSSGQINITGGGSIKGNAAGNEIFVDGGGSVQGGRLDYGDMYVPDWYQSQGDGFWYNAAEKNELSETIIADPLGLKAALQQAEYVDSAGVKKGLTNLPQTRLYDAFGQLEYGQKKEIGQWPFQRSRLSPGLLEVYNADEQVSDWQPIDLPFYNPVSFLGDQLSIATLQDFKIKSGGTHPSLRVFGGDVVLFIDGDVEMDGGASMMIEPNSSLTLIVTGQFKLAGGFNFMNESVVNESGMPLFSLLSVNETDTAVSIKGGTKLYGAVYSISSLNLGGSGTIVGQAFGANINVSGGTGIDFIAIKDDDLLGDAGSGGGGNDNYAPEFDRDFEIDFY